MNFKSQLPLPATPKSVSQEESLPDSFFRDENASDGYVIWRYSYSQNCTSNRKNVNIMHEFRWWDLMIKWENADSSHQQTPYYFQIIQDSLYSMRNCRFRSPANTILFSNNLKLIILDGKTSELKWLKYTPMNKLVETFMSTVTNNH